MSLTIPSRLMWCLVLACALWPLVGCSTPEPLPQHEWHGLEHALATIEQRQERIRTLSAECRLTLRRANGDVVTLDGLMVLRRPDHLRAQAWKFDQKVLDLTVRPDGVWMWTSDRVEDDGNTTPGAMNGGGANWLAALFSVPSAPDAQVIELGNKRKPMVVRWRRGNEASAGGMQLAIDRPTLTVRAFEVLDDQGKPVQRVALGRYRLVDGVALPTRIRAAGDEGAMEVRLREVALNEVLADGVFEPPADAERLE